MMGCIRLPCTLWWGVVDCLAHCDAGYSTHSGLSTGKSGRMSNVQSLSLVASAVLIWCRRPGGFLEPAWSSVHPGMQKNLGSGVSPEWQKQPWLQGRWRVMSCRTAGKQAKDFSLCPLHTLATARRCHPHSVSMFSFQLIINNPHTGVPYSCGLSQGQV